ncbi:exported hypothetical protein [Candidatus Defluviicoccus seviourii]|uniref:Uncharacterized protein n=1 Tax=Candidatus Defluviicoccus seviourii TaxID=2565273 RepID=A0A564WIY3_9PROT|nr:exported hypothetical protein [Candidatus Defluviicoccus seviourii]
MRTLAPRPRLRARRGRSAPPARSVVACPFPWPPSPFAPRGRVMPSETTQAGRIHATAALGRAATWTRLQATEGERPRTPSWRGAEAPKPSRGSNGLITLDCFPVRFRARSQ